jgi:nucleoside-diphosphate-sugar epimerase
MLFIAQIRARGSVSRGSVSRLAMARFAALQREDHLAFRMIICESDDKMLAVHQTPNSMAALLPAAAVDWYKRFFVATRAKDIRNIMKRRSVVMFGSSGRVGRAVAGALAKIGCPVEAVSWLDAKTRTARDQREILAQLAAVKGDVDIVFASGLTDPSASMADLALANVERPIGVIEATIGWNQFRYLTIGSVLETLSDLAASNRYLASKAALWARIKGLAADPRLNGRIMHLRGHTFYGGAPAPHLFLGQMYDSLRAGQPFRMSEGRQLREYAHVDDVALSIIALLARAWTGSTAIDLSTGEPVRLSELARAVFRAFDCERLLQLGALPTPAGENLGVKFPRSPAWLLGQPRPADEGIIEWFSDLLDRPRTG